MKLDPPNRAVRPRLNPSVLLILMALGLSACASMSGIQPQASLRDAASLGLPAEPGAPAAVNAPWWREFGDEQLNRLVDEALVSNPSLKTGPNWAVPAVPMRRPGRTNESNWPPALADIA